MWPSHLGRVESPASGDFSIDALGGTACHSLPLAAAFMTQTGTMDDEG